MAVMNFRYSTRRLVLLFLVIIFLIGGVVYLGLDSYLKSPADKDGKAQLVIIREGLTLNEVARELEKRRLVRHRSIFVLWAEWKGYGTRIKAGEYRLSAAMSPVGIMEKLTRGEVITYPVTIPEGYTLAQIAAALGEKGLVGEKHFLSLCTDKKMIARFGIQGTSLEGYLYPDTYQFARGISPLSVTETMVHRFRQMVKPLEGRDKEVGMTMRDVVILASIVEKETGKAEERPLIASVFLNRLKKGMRLESDPTVIYGIKDFNGNLTRKDLSTPTPYNTYVIRGLPPGPIANPGLASIRAVLYPAETDYLYFVSKNDGSHYFSKTLREHNRAVRKYQKRRRPNPRELSWSKPTQQLCV
jgi:UPF0755 protein